jgi:peptide methionine sulfoxide reductase MsrB
LLFNECTLVPLHCGNPLYSAESKFNSGCGWPAFDKCYKGGVKTEMDVTFGMKRIGACVRAGVTHGKNLRVIFAHLISFSPGFGSSMGFCSSSSASSSSSSLSTLPKKHYSRRRFALLRRHTPTEIMCAACDGHLGHVFENEGFTSTMERHCVNSVSVKFVKEAPPTPMEEEKVSTGEGGGGSFGKFVFPLVMLGVAYTLSGLVGKLMDRFMGP